MGVVKLSVVVNLAGQIGVIFVSRLQHYLFASEDVISPLCSIKLSAKGHGELVSGAHLGSIGQLVGGQIDLAKAPLPDKSTNLVIPNSAKFRRRKLSASNI